jgi:hypothetical protein
MTDSVGRRGRANAHRKFTPLGEVEAKLSWGSPTNAPPGFGAGDDLELHDGLMRGTMLLLPLGGIEGTRHCWRVNTTRPLREKACHVRTKARLFT